MERTDTELIAAVRRGNKQAFGQLIDRYHQMVKRIALRMLANEVIAQDLAQEAILQAYLSLESLRDPNRFPSWLYGITLNVCRSYLRNRKVDFLSTESLTGGLRYEDPYPTVEEVDPQEVVEARELYALVLEAVNALSAKNRTATLMFYYEQMSVREIAAILDISISAVKSRLYQSRIQLRQELASIYREETVIDSTRERREKMVKVSIADVVVQLKESMHRIVVLQDEEGQRALPIWIGPFEADSLCIVLADVEVARPLTYDFMVKILEALDAKLEEVRIENLKGKTFYAIAKVRSRKIVQEIDVRPSDALALALRTGSPIYVSEQVMNEAGVAIPEQGKEPTPIAEAYYSPVRDKIANSSAEQLTKASKYTGLFGDVNLKEQQRSEQPYAEVEEQKKQESLRTRQELVAFVFGN